MQTWLYEKSIDNSVRYMLGITGKKTVICFGINPSTAEPNKLDPTLKRVEKIALNNGFDSWVMFNVYPVRSTDFEKLSDSNNVEIHNENIRIINKFIAERDNITVWVAWGEKIEKRKYLIPCLKDIFNNIKGDNINWVATGVNKNGSPKHPLYQKVASKLTEFNMAKYMDALNEKKDNF